MPWVALIVLIFLAHQTCNYSGDSSFEHSHYREALLMSNSRKRGRPQAAIHVHFKRVPKSGELKYDQAECNHCEKKFAYSKQSLNRHTGNCAQVRRLFDLRL